MVKKYNNLLSICGLLIVCLSAACLSISRGGDKTYEINPEIWVPEQKTDIARVIEAYERLMNNYMYLSENNLTCIQTDVGDVNIKLGSIEREISVIRKQLETISAKLGIEPTPEAITKTANTQEIGQADEKQAENPE